MTTSMPEVAMVHFARNNEGDKSLRWKRNKNFAHSLEHEGYYRCLVHAG